MQEIKMVTYSRPDLQSSYTRHHFYRLNFPGLQMNFKSKKKLLAKLAEINRELNEHSHTLNAILADVYREYRYYYFHLTEAEIQSIEADLNAITKTFRMLITRSAGSSGNYFTFDRFRKLIYYLTNVVEVLERNRMNRLATVQRYRLKTLKTAIATVETALKRYSPEKEKIKFENY